MGNDIPSFLLQKASTNDYRRGRGKLRSSFLEKGIHHLVHVVKTGYIQWETAARDSFFQRIDPRIKVLFLLFFILIISLKKDIFSEALIGGFIFLLTVISRLNIPALYRRVLFLAFVFGFLIALPAAFNFITEGEVVLRVWQLQKPYSFWIYRLPAEIGLTREGIYGVVMLTLRVANSLALSLLVLYTTPFPEIIKALKTLRIADGFLMIVMLTYKYIFIFARTVEDMHLAKKSRLVRPADNAEARGWVAGRIALIFRRTQLRCEEIFKAMLSRGFSEEVRMYEARKLKTSDWAVSAALLLIGALFLWV